MIETVALFQAMKWILEIFGCKHKIICYNKNRKGNRHRVVDLDKKNKAFPHSPKYRGGFVILVTSHKNECQKC